MESHPAGNHPGALLLPAVDLREILDNVDGCMHGPMSGFIKKYFGTFQYNNEDASLEIRAPGGGVRGRCAIPPTAPSPSDFLPWFTNFFSWERDGGARGSWHVVDGNAAPDNNAFGHYDATTTASDGVRLLLTMPTLSGTPGAQARWDHVQVIGQFHQQSSVCYQHGLTRLCLSAAQVFLSQPTRLFLHGFYIRGSLVEFWMFDRSGLYCSDVLDMQKDFIQFLSIILSYQRMTDRDLGASNIIETDEDGSYIRLDGGVTTPSSGTKLRLQRHPFVSSEGVVGTGTTCYRAAGISDLDRWHHVVKFKWRWARDRPEDEFLRRVAEKHVWGAVSLDYYRELESTADLRRSLRWGTLQKFAAPQPPPETQVGVVDEQQGPQAACTADGLADHTEETGTWFQNRILTCTITSPLGRPLHTFLSLTELLQVFRDAIKCHQSLYYDAEVLHQDVSHGNIVILDGQNEGKPKGILIDLDSAVDLTEEQEMEPGITGTRPFMAIGVLNSERHTYRHDLESFLYVFLWIIIANHTDNPPETSRLRQWSNTGWDELAARKTSDMTEERFRDILEEFAPEFHPLKPVAQNLRHVLFPLKDDVIWTGTDDSSEAVDKLYNGMIHAFEGFIEPKDEVAN